MNKVFKLKWNAATQSYMACSELTKRAGKSVALGAAILLGNTLTSTSAYAVDCSLTNGSYYVSWNSRTMCDNVPENSNFQLINPRNIDPFYAIIGPEMRAPATIGNATATLQGSSTATFIGNRQALGSNGAAVVANNITANLTAGKQAFLFRTSHGLNITAKNVQATLNVGGASSSSNFDIINTAILVGGNQVTANQISENDPAANGTFTTVTVDNLDINSTAFNSTKNLVNIGLRAVQGGDGSSGKIIVKDKLNLFLSGSNIQGIYASGAKANAAGIKAVSTVELNNTDIALKVEGMGFAELAESSSAIKIGLAHTAAKGEGEVHSKGRLNITSDLVGAAGIKLYHSNSLFKADYENSRTVINTSGPAIQVSGKDGSNSDVASSENITVSLKNANLSGGRGALLKVYENQKNVVFNFTGNDTILKAGAGAGATWLIEVGAHESDTPSITSGSSTVNFMGGLYFGPVTISDRNRANPSTLTINLDGANTIWYLPIRLDESASRFTPSEFTTLNISNGATLDTTHWNLLMDVKSDSLGIWNQYIVYPYRISSTYTNGTTKFGNRNVNTELIGDINNNSGTINLSTNETSDIRVANRLKINGNYSGSGDAKIKLNTLWNAPGDEQGGNSISDYVHITGSATGTTKVIAVGKNNQEGVISGSIQRLVGAIANTVPVVKVDGNAAANAFTGTAQTTGAGEAQLTSRLNGSTREFFWTLSAQGSAPVTPPALPPAVSPVTPPVTPPTTNPVTPPTTNPVTPPTTGTIIPPAISPFVPPVTPPALPAATQPTNAPIIYSPTVPGYVQAPKANLELGYTTLATLHERRGENQTLAWDECGTCGEKADGQTWARVFGKHLELSGKERLSFDADIFGIQAGHDFAVQRTDEGGHHLTGAFLTYSNMKSEFSDLYRAVGGVIQSDKVMGSAKTANISLGASHTRYAPNGAYVDLVGQIGVLSTKFNARNGTQATQKGNNLILSAEVGRPYALAEHKANEAVWFLEPQAQLSYQFLKLKGFTDGIRTVAAGSHHGLRARVGVRLAYNTQAAEDKYRTNSFYVIANVLQDLNNAKGVQIGSDNVKETYAKTWFELGLGGQLPVGKQSYVYADGRYERNLGGATRQGYRATVGFKYTWK